MTSTTADRRNGVSGNLGFKAPCIAGSTANLTLSSTQTVDGVALAADDRVLVKNQTTTTENGIYKVVTGAAWTRDIDFNGSLDVTRGTAVLIAAGTLYARTIWSVSSTGDNVPGTDTITFAQAST